MPEEVLYYVTSYGYLAIFVLIFLQEIGMPNPFPNELLLIFSGYLTYKGILILPVVILTAVLADFIGTNVLYFLFYTTGTLIIKKRPKWINLSDKMIDRLTLKLSSGGKLSMYVFRVTPFTRGYTSVISGLRGIKPKVFLPIALLSAITWASIYVFIGRLIGPSWSFFSQKMDSFKYIMLAVLALTLCAFLIIYLIRQREKQKQKKNPVVDSL